MPRRPAPRRSPRPAPATEARRRGRRRLLVAGLIIAAVVLGVGVRYAIGPGALDRAQEAEAAKDWPKALAAYRRVNRSPAARGRTWLGEARACLALDLAAQAESALIRASEADPADPEPWRLRLDILRAEGRTTEAQRVGWSAYAAIDPGARRAILRELTLALLLPDDALDDLPDARVRARLDRWAEADPMDSDARVARRRRLADVPRPGAPDLDAWIAILTSALDLDPGRASAREALVIALDERGDPEGARRVLAAWPEPDRDARYERLVGRRALDDDHDPARAAEALERAVAELPQDWKIRARLARAYHALGRPADASREASRVAMLRELLDPATLVPRLASDLSRPDDARARADLADLADLAGLGRLADAWRREGPAGPAR